MSRVPVSVDQRADTRAAESLVQGVPELRGRFRGTAVHEQSTGALREQQHVAARTAYLDEPVAQRHDREDPRGALCSAGPQTGDAREDARTQQARRCAQEATAVSDSGHLVQAALAVGQLLA